MIRTMARVTDVHHLEGSLASMKPPLCIPRESLAHSGLAEATCLGDCGLGRHFRRINMKHMRHSASLPSSPTPGHPSFTKSTTSESLQHVQICQLLRLLAARTSSSCTV